MTPGKKYRIIHKSEEQRVPRESVLKFLGTSVYGDPVFSARPVAGTQEMPYSWIISTTHVPDDEPIVLNKVKKGRR